jgi:hypothetical protein
MAKTVILRTIERRHMSQTELARRIGKGTVWTWRLVHGLAEPRHDEKQRISRLLRRPMKVLFDRETGKAAFVAEEVSEKKCTATKILCPGICVSASKVGGKKKSKEAADN